MCRKPDVTIRPSELISPCKSALVATVVPWARPTTLSAVAPLAARILSTPRKRPIAGFAGVLATLVTCVAPDTRSTDTMSVKVPPVSMPIRNRGDADACDMRCCRSAGRIGGNMRRAGHPSQKLNIDAAIGKADGGDIELISVVRPSGLMILRMVLVVTRA